MTGLFILDNIFKDEMNKQARWYSGYNETRFLAQGDGDEIVSL